MISVVGRLAQQFVAVVVFVHLKAYVLRALEGFADLVPQALFAPVLSLQLV
jgi:hypothetical protein